jgi:hypothetical protein
MAASSETFLPMPRTVNLGRADGQIERVDEVNKADERQPAASIIAVNDG